VELFYHFGAVGRSPDNQLSFSKGKQGMDKDRIAGSAKEAKGGVEEIVGKAIGDAKLESDGRPTKSPVRFKMRSVD
jgi:hypothetical protein